MFAEKEDSVKKLSKTPSCSAQTPTPKSNVFIDTEPANVQNWCVWAKYRTIVPNLGTPGERLASEVVGRRGENGTIAEICQFHPELPAGLLGA